MVRQAKERVPLVREVQDPAGNKEPAKKDPLLIEIPPQQPHQTRHQQAPHPIVLALDLHEHHLETRITLKHGKDPHQHQRNQRVNKELFHRQGERTLPQETGL